MKAILSNAIRDNDDLKKQNIKKEERIGNLELELSNKESQLTEVNLNVEKITKTNENLSQAISESENKNKSLTTQLDQQLEKISKFESLNEEKIHALQDEYNNYKKKYAEQVLSQLNSSKPHILDQSREHFLFACLNDMKSIITNQQINFQQLKKQSIDYEMKIRILSSNLEIYKKSAAVHSSKIVLFLEKWNRDIQTFQNKIIDKTVQIYNRILLVETNLMESIHLIGNRIFDLSNSQENSTIIDCHKTNDISKTTQQLKPMIEKQDVKYLSMNVDLRKIIETEPTENNNIDLSDLSNEDIIGIVQESNDLQRQNELLKEQINLLKNEINRVDKNEELSKILQNSEYVKNVILKFITSNPQEKSNMLDILVETLKLNVLEKEEVVNSFNETGDQKSSGVIRSILPTLKKWF